MLNTECKVKMDIYGGVGGRDDDSTLKQVNVKYANRATERRITLILSISIFSSQRTFIFL